VDDAFLRPGRFNYKVLVPLPNAEELAEILLIHLEMAEQRAETPEQFCEALRAAIRQDRGQWLLDQFKAKHDDPSGVVRLARVMAQHEMTGADVEEIVNRAIMDTVAAEVMGIDPGPITPEDLERHMNDYLQSRKHVQEETGS
jgi:SpoVK/Ycf46/Vps4 family AAA+-type ATPase